MDDEDAFTKVFAMSDLLDAVVMLLRWTLENPEVVTVGEAYMKGGEQ